MLSPEDNRIRAQDALVTESCGAVVDRSLEHLGPSDRAVIALRRWALRRAKQCAGGETPATGADSVRYRARALQLWCDGERPLETLPGAEAAFGSAQDAPAAGA
jgi:phthalate 4,5-dioxygenase oxygenase subunit